ncbi:O-antigen ligase domain-containing protein [bacterium]|nr:MAG: O-antigen ligase domain-containing protein [bacterium]
MANSFTRKTSWLWQNAEKVLIILFLATFTLNIRKVFLTPYSFLNGTFNEYLTMSFSWADALMIAAILIYTIKYILRQFKSPSSSLRETSQRGTIKENNRGYLSSVIHCITNVSRETYLLLLFVTWSFVSIAWSPYSPIAIYRSLTMLEILLFFFIVYKNLVANSHFTGISLIALMINGFIQAIIGILQFIYGNSIGLRFLGESIVSRETPGVAKIVIVGMKHIRAYGTFPHPNILAGFLIIPIFLILVELLKRFAFTKNCDEKVSRETLFSIIPSWLIIISFLILITGFLLTFSRSAFLGFILGLLVFGFIQKKTILKVSRLAVFSCLILFILCLGYFVHSNKDLVSLSSTQSLQERIFYQNVARETISAHPLVGVGAGQSIFDEFKKYPNLEGWQYQPVHNLYLLIFSELGIVGLIFFLLWIFSIMEWGIGKNGNTGVLLTNNIFYCIIFSFLLVFLFDHYLWDIKLGIIIFTLPILFLKATSCTKA